MASKIESRSGRLPPHLRQSATFENGKEFAEHERLSRRLKLDVYFAGPYCAWQRGTNEHSNGILRQFIPKVSDLLRISWQELERFTKLTKHRPRKRLNYRARAEVLEPLVAAES